MAKNNIIEVILFGQEIGKLGYDVDKRASYFQYNPDFLEANQYTNIFPYVFKRIKPVQVFNKFEGETFRGLPPMIADSLPDMFGNIIFKEWFEAKNKEFKKITPLEQLTYVSNRGMGALEYRPTAEIPKSSTINIDEIVEVLNKVLDLKNETAAEALNDAALLNIFKIGTSAGGARPKILISEHKETGKIIPGDIEYSNAYNHYLVKLSMNEEWGYNKEKVEYAYYLMAQEVGIQMMPSKLIENKHFATLRYDRQNGEKQHVLTASGLTGWDFKKPDSDPVMIVSINPDYPISAITRNIEGYVTLEYTVGKDGATRDIRIIESYPSSTFDKSAIRALEKYKYQPAILNGVAIETRGHQIKLTYKMED